MRSDRGNATVEFVAVVPLVLLVGLSVLQFALLAHAQSVVDAAAGEAARVAAVSAEPLAAARSAAEDMIGSALGEVPITGFSMSHGRASGMETVSVTVQARPALALLPDVVEVSGTGRALVEAAP